MRKYIAYFIFAIFSVFMIFFLNIKITKNIQNVKESFDKTEIAILNELAFNISNIIKKYAKNKSLYDTLKNDDNSKVELEHLLEVIISKKYKYAFVVQKVKDNRYRFLLDGSLENKSTLGEPFHAINKAWSEVYKLKKPLSFKEDDLESIWMTYLYPIIIDDEIKAILAIDFSKKQIEETLGYLKPINNFINYIVVGLFLIVGLLFIFVILWFIENRESAKRKEKLEKNKIYLEKATKEAQVSSVAKSEFLANMSHEIRTPMNAIIGLTDLVLNTTMSDKQKDYISKIKLSSISLLTIINDILDFSKIEAGKMKIQKSDFLISGIAKKVDAIFYPLVKEKNINFKIVVDKNIPECFVGDRIRLEQVIINLLSNAFKFTQDGDITFMIKYFKDSKYNFEFLVKDSGIGIAQDKISTLFDSFSQVNNSRTKKFAGTGLGLSISRQIIKLFGGTIEVKSKLGEGSVFRVKLNLKECTSCKISDSIVEQEIDIREKLLTYRNVDILIAEDNLINQDVIKGHLEQFDFNISIVEDGSKCLEKATKIKYDLILMDINMPVMSGYEATKLIREFDTAIPIIALSANARSEDYEHSKEIGMNAHVSKPIDFENLYKILDKYLPKDKLNNANIELKSSEISNIDYNFTLINSQKVLKNFNNNHTIYRTILTTYYDLYKNCIEDIKRMNTEELKNFFHQFKSTSGTIGADTLFEKISFYYTELLDRKNDLSLLEEIYKEIKLVNAEVLLYLKQFEKNKNKIDNSEEISDIEVVNRAIQELQDALETKKSKLIKNCFILFDKLNLNKKDTELKYKLEKQIKSYNYLEALRYMKER